MFCLLTATERHSFLLFIVNTGENTVPVAHRKTATFLIDRVDTNRQYLDLLRQCTVSGAQSSASLTSDSSFTHWLGVKSAVSRDRLRSILYDGRLFQHRRGGPFALTGVSQRKSAIFSRIMS